METSFWLGLEALHQLTNSGGYTRMRAEMYADDNAWYSAEYEYFKVDNETTEYQLSLYGHSGDAENQLWKTNGRRFSTYDHGMGVYSAFAMQGGWWYSTGNENACLNGGYEIYKAQTTHTGFYWNAGSRTSPPEISALDGVTPGRLLMSRIMITRP